MKPRIGITMDEDEAGTPPRRRFHLFALYARAVFEAGGIPLALPSVVEACHDYGTCLDGLLVTGGDFDIPPHYYGATAVHQAVKPLEGRSAFELQTFKDFLAQGKAILGICGGAQLINVAFGGSLIQDIPSMKKEHLDHAPPPPRTKPAHAVVVTAQGSQLARIVQKKELRVNSAHHQAVDAVGEGLEIVAKAPDDIVEAIEAPSHRFCVGVQWHPEFHVDAGDAALFKAFVGAAAKS